MAARTRSRLPPGRQPWDPLNGLRIGALTGALVGAALIALTGTGSFWIIAVTGTIGGAAGFRVEQRKQRTRSEQDRQAGTAS